ncbi:hypothetical protein [Pseudalkalibacillus caeni]|uniref:hypothetical protein n=1 Tax=Exobacillus caeni TaxID=2574798 RepID=UPI001485B845|nr:hypothetical protein [Pseudalkalibacillus caeni]
MTEEEVKRYNELLKQFQTFVNRSLTKKEIEFIKWIVKRSMEVEYIEPSKE